MSPKRSCESLSDQEVKRLIEDMLLHYKKPWVREEEMLKFFRSRGIEIKNRRKLRFTIYHAETVVDWLEHGILPDRKLMISVKYPDDLEEILERIRANSK